MDTVALKKEINQIVEHLPDSLLIELLGHLREVDKSSSSAQQRAQYLRKILQEDRQLLEKLAK
ncbi:hypothetical protein GCM10028807_42690 [Spirosoma daeguense]